MAYGPILSTRGVLHYTHRHPEKHLRGERNPAHVLTDAAVWDIRARYAPRRCGYRQLAREYHVAKPTIVNVVKRHSWTHI
jgi:hypothetical protein